MSLAADMADRITDEELIDALRQFGDTVKVPIDRKKRPILIKKLNHYRARENVANKQKKSQNSRKKQVVEFSSEDESEEEPAPITPSCLLGRRPVRQNKSFGYSNTETIEVSPPSSKSLRSRNSTASNKLYPDLSEFDANTSNSSKVWENSTSNDKPSYDNEFTDSDPDESVYEVTNKSINTTFTLHERNREDCNNDKSFASKYGRLGNNVSADASPNVINRKNIASNHVSTSSFTEEEIRQQGFKTCDDARKYKQPAASYISTGILVVTAIFFTSLAAIYLYLCRDIIYSMVMSAGFSRRNNGKQFLSD